MNTQGRYQMPGSISDSDSDPENLMCPDFSALKLRRCPKHRLTMRAICVTCRRPLCNAGIGNHRNNTRCDIMYPKQDPDAYKSLVAELIKDINTMVVFGFYTANMSRLVIVLKQMESIRDESGDLGEINLNLFNKAIDLLDEWPHYGSSKHSDALQFKMEDVKQNSRAATDSAGVSHYKSELTFKDSRYYENYVETRASTGGYNGGTEDTSNDSWYPEQDVINEELIPATDNSAHAHATSETAAPTEAGSLMQHPCDTERGARDAQRNYRRRRERIHRISASRNTFADAPLSTVASDAIAPPEEACIVESVVESETAQQCEGAMGPAASFDTSMHSRPSTAPIDIKPNWERQNSYEGFHDRGARYLRDSAPEPERIRRFSGRHRTCADAHTQDIVPSPMDAISAEATAATALPSCSEFMDIYNSSLSRTTEDEAGTTGHISHAANSDCSLRCPHVGMVLPNGPPSRKTSSLTSTGSSISPVMSCFQCNQAGSATSTGFSMDD